MKSAAPRTCLQVLLLGLALLASSTIHAAATEPQSLLDALRAQRSELAIDAGTLQGSGAPWLLQQAAAAQFVLIGEDHGFADVPEFALALQQSMGQQRFAHLVLEVGPLSTARVEAALRKRSDGLARLHRQFPFALPFLALQEDGALAAAFVVAPGPAPKLWGIDQEFILATRMHLDQLQALAPDAAGRAVVRRYREQADHAWARMVEQHSPQHLALTTWTASDFAALRNAFGASPAAPALALVDAMETSAQIYREQNSAPYASNLARSQLMKRQFMDYYDTAARQQPAPRALFKLGAYHAGRGLSPTGVFDIGNLASELAQAGRRRSFHILVLCAAGEVNRYFPFSASRSDARLPYDAAAELGQLDAQVLLDASASDSISLFDLAQLRDYTQPRPPAGSKLAALIFNYDAVVVIPQARAASHYR